MTLKKLSRPGGNPERDGKALHSNDFSRIKGSKSTHESIATGPFPTLGETIAKAFFELYSRKEISI